MTGANTTFHPTATILVTAFGPFDGRPENASSLALARLKKAFPAIRTRILPVDCRVAPARLKQALRVVRPDVLIMLGEAAGSDKIRLETTAWNELDFRIPDIAGRQPQGIPVRPGAAASLSSTLPLHKIHALLESAGHGISFSDNPGRYLCNQVFHTALDYIERRDLRCMAGFIHLPLAADHDTAASADALGQILGVVLAHHASGS